MKHSLGIIGLILSTAVFGQSPDQAPSDSCQWIVPNMLSMNCRTGEEFLFAPKCTCDLLNFKLTIYNRWGEILFESEKELVWQDKTQPNGVYVWRITGEYLNAEPFSLNGDLSYLR